MKDNNSDINNNNDMIELLYNTMKMKINDDDKGEYQSILSKRRTIFFLDPINKKPILTREGSDLLKSEHLKVANNNKDLRETMTQFNEEQQEEDKKNSEEIEKMVKKLEENGKEKKNNALHRLFFRLGSEIISYLSEELKLTDNRQKELLMKLGSDDILKLYAYSDKDWCFYVQDKKYADIVERIKNTELLKALIEYINKSDIGEKNNYATKMKRCCEVFDIKPNAFRDAVVYESRNFTVDINGITLIRSPKKEEEISKNITFGNTITVNKEKEEYRNIINHEDNKYIENNNNNNIINNDNNIIDENKKENKIENENTIKIDLNELLNKNKNKIKSNYESDLENNSNNNYNNNIIIDDDISSNNEDKKENENKNKNLNIEDNINTNNFEIEEKIENSDNKSCDFSVDDLDFREEKHPYVPNANFKNNNNFNNFNSNDSDVSKEFNRDYYNYNNKNDKNKNKKEIQTITPDINNFKNNLENEDENFESKKYNSNNESYIENKNENIIKSIKVDNENNIKSSKIEEDIKNDEYKEDENEIKEEEKSKDEEIIINYSNDDIFKNDINNFKNNNNIIIDDFNPNENNNIIIDEEDSSNNINNKSNIETKKSIIKENFKNNNNIIIDDFNPNENKNFNSDEEDNNNNIKPKIKTTSNKEDNNFSDNILKNYIEYKNSNNNFLDNLEDDLSILNSEYKIKNKNDKKKIKNNESNIKSIKVDNKNDIKSSKIEDKKEEEYNINNNNYNNDHFDNSFNNNNNFNPNENKNLNIEIEKKIKNSDNKSCDFSVDDLDFGEEKRPYVPNANFENSNNNFNNSKLNIENEDENNEKKNEKNEENSKKFREAVIGLGEDIWKKTRFYLPKEVYETDVLSRDSVYSILQVVRDCFWCYCFMGGNINEEFKQKIQKVIEIVKMFDLSKDTDIIYEIFRIKQILLKPKINFDELEKKVEIFKKYSTEDEINKIIKIQRWFRKSKDNKLKKENNDNINENINLNKNENNIKTYNSNSEDKKEEEESKDEEIISNHSNNDIFNSNNNNYNNDNYNNDNPFKNTNNNSNNESYIENKEDLKKNDENIKKENEDDLNDLSSKNNNNFNNFNSDEEDNSNDSDVSKEFNRDYYNYNNKNDKNKNKKEIKNNIKIDEYNIINNNKDKKKIKIKNDNNNNYNNTNNNLENEDSSKNDDNKNDIKNNESNIKSIKVDNKNDIKSSKIEDKKKNEQFIKHQALVIRAEKINKRIEQHNKENKNSNDKKYQVVPIDINNVDKDDIEETNEKLNKAIEVAEKELKLKGTVVIQVVDLETDKIICETATTIRKHNEGNSRIKLIFKNEVSKKKEDVVDIHNLEKYYKNRDKINDKELCIAYSIDEYGKEKRFFFKELRRKNTKLENKTNEQIFLVKMFNIGILGSNLGFSTYTSSVKNIGAGVKVKKTRLIDHKDQNIKIDDIYIEPDFDENENSINNLENEDSNNYNYNTNNFEDNKSNTTKKIEYKNLNNSYYNTKKIENEYDIKNEDIKTGNYGNIYRTTQKIKNKNDLENNDFNDSDSLGFNVEEEFTFNYHHYKNKNEDKNKIINISILNNENEEKKENKIQNIKVDDKDNEFPNNNNYNNDISEIKENFKYNFHNSFNGDFLNISEIKKNNETEDNLSILNSEYEEKKENEYNIHNSFNGNFLNISEIEIIKNKKKEDLSKNIKSLKAHLEKQGLIVKRENVMNGCAIMLSFGPNLCVKLGNVKDYLVVQEAFDTFKIDLLRSVSRLSGKKSKSENRQWKKIGHLNNDEKQKKIFEQIGLTILPKVKIEKTAVLEKKGVKVEIKYLSSDDKKEKEPEKNTLNLSTEQELKETFEGSKNTRKLIDFVKTSNYFLLNGKLMKMNENEEDDVKSYEERNEEKINLRLSGFKRKISEAYKNQTFLKGLSKVGEECFSDNLLFFNLRKNKNIQNISCNKKNEILKFESLNYKKEKEKNK